MDDNLSLTPKIRKRYERFYQGVFYQRYVRGEWVAAQGLVYPMFQPDAHIAEIPAPPERCIISCDYGTVNPTSLGLWGLCGGVWYRMRESYYDTRKTGISRTDEEHYAALEALAGNLHIEQVIADPSAASFIACIRKHGKFTVVPSKNDVRAASSGCGRFCSTGSMPTTPTTRSGSALPSATGGSEAEPSAMKATAARILRISPSAGISPGASAGSQSPEAAAVSSPRIRFTLTRSATAAYKKQHL